MNEYIAGSTNLVDLLYLLDSTSLTGGGKTGLSYSSSGLTCYYKRSSGPASVAVALVAITTLGTYTSGGFREIDSTGMPGCYEFHPPAAAFASGAKEVTFVFTGATGLVARPVKYRITGGVDLDNAINAGLSALPATSCTTNASLLTSGTGTDQLSVSVGKTLLQATQTGVTIPTVATVTGSVGSVTGAVGSVTGSVSSVTGAVGSVVGAVGSVVGNVGGNVLGAVASVTGSVGSVAGVIFPTNFALQQIDNSGRVAADVLAWATYAVSADASNFPLVGTVNTLASTGLNSVLVAGVSLPNALRYIGAVVSGVITTSQTSLEVFKDYAGQVAVSVVADSSGNRSVVTLS